MLLALGHGDGEGVVAVEVGQPDPPAVAGVPLVRVLAVEEDATGVVGGADVQEGTARLRIVDVDVTKFDAIALVDTQPGTGNSECRTIVSSLSSHIESDSSCEDWTPVLRGDSTLSCLIINTEFFEGIPTLSRSGLLLASILLLLTGLFATRRF